MVISQKIKETKMGYRGSKSDTVVSVKEQRVDGSYCKTIKVHSNGFRKKLSS